MRDKLEKSSRPMLSLSKSLQIQLLSLIQKEYARVAKEHSNQADLVLTPAKYITAPSDIGLAKTSQRHF